jgi:two-component system response regulator HydG
MPGGVKPASLEVLVVDDHPDTRNLVVDFCAQLGFSVTQADDGRAATNAILRSPRRFEVVVTDLNMPGADGFEVLRVAKAVNPSSYVVMISGYATLDTALRAVREGAYDYLPKPFALGQMEALFRRIRERMGLEEENRALHARLDAIAGRLHRIEELLTRLTNRT